MEILANLITGPMIYLAIGLLLLGIIYRISQWLSVPVSSINLGIYPKAQGAAKRVGIFRDTFFFPQVAEANRGMWVAAILMHLAILGVFVGHLRMLGRFPGPLEQVMSESAHFAGGTMGILFLLGIIYFLFRRFKSPERELSIPEDYFLLFLLLILVLLGDHLRLFGHIPFGAYREWGQSVLSFNPTLPQAISNSPQMIVFVGHVFTANLLFIYLPFSKLMHFIGALFTNGIRRG